MNELFVKKTLFKWSYVFWCIAASSSSLIHSSASVKNKHSFYQWKKLIHTKLINQHIKNLKSLFGVTEFNVFTRLLN